MTDPYRVTEPSQPPQDAPAPTGRRDVLRPVLWLLLLICAAANMVTSTVASNVFIGIGFGLATLACAIALVVHHYRRRRG